MGLNLSHSDWWQASKVTPLTVVVEFLPDSFELSSKLERPKIIRKSEPRAIQKRGGKVSGAATIGKGPTPPKQNRAAGETLQAEQKRARLSYLQALNAYISQNKSYPRQARKLKQSGTVSVRFHINSEGEFQHVHLEKGCNHKALNSAAVKLIKKLGKFKPLPKKLGENQGFVVPIQYRMTRGS